MPLDELSSQHPIAILNFHAALTLAGAFELTAADRALLQDCIKVDETFI
jgi:hypothetical protein